MRSYREIAREHALRLELKFDAPEGGGVRATRGTLRRRQVVILWAEHLGKEGNLLGQRAEGGDQLDELQQRYDDPAAFRREIVPLLRQSSPDALAQVSRVSDRAMREIWRDVRCREPRFENGSFAIVRGD